MANLIMWPIGGIKSLIIKILGGIMVINGMCSNCGREYEDIVNGPCPSDDCPGNERIMEADGLTQWLSAACGEREREILQDSRCYRTNYDDEYPNNRLPKGQYYFKSPKGQIMVDFNRRKIVG